MMKPKKVSNKPRAEAGLSPAARMLGSGLRQKTPAPAPDATWQQRRLRGFQKG